jgi:hypothetical protein
VLLGLALAGPALAAPTAGELRATCETALADAYRGEAAAMCDWYVAPCGVCGPDGPPPKGWCLPPGLADSELAQVVVEDLRGGDDARPAPDAVKEILRRRFPCDAEE